MKIKITTLSLLLAFYTLSAQKNLPLQKLTPKRFIDKVEILVGPNITFPNGKDNVAGNNPRISTGYSPKAGYLVGIGIIHSFGNFEIRGRASWDQRGYVQKLWDNEPTGLFESVNETKSYFYSLGIIPALYVGKSKKFHFLLGATFSRLDHAESVQTLTRNGSVQSIFRTRYSAGQAGIKGNLLDAVFGVGYIVYSKNKQELSVNLQNNYGYTDSVNQNGNIIKNNSLYLIIQFKIIR